MLGIKLFVSLVFTLSGSSGRINYCDICGSHTLCKYSVSGPNKRCINYDTTAMLTQHNVEEILQRVNEKRNFVALGLSQKLPKAANMLKIRWSDDLSTLAQRWVDQCLESDVIDECRDLGANVSVGQNIASVMGPSPGLNVKAFVDIWFMQVLDYNGSISYYNRSQDSGTNFFTQLIWAETDLMGCGKAKFFLTNKRSITERLVCNFAPKGDIDGKPVYTIGFPSTQCPKNMKPDDLFTGLCSPEDNRDKFSTTSVPPISSLLRIINLSNHGTENETDPNGNINNKEHINQRLQKIRHIFNDTDLSKLHDAEEKFKDYLMQYTGDHTFYDYIHGRTEVHSYPLNTPQVILFSTTSSYDVQPTLYQNPYYHRQPNINSRYLCTRYGMNEKFAKYHELSILFNRCTRKGKELSTKKDNVASQHSTHCNCNADCTNPTDIKTNNNESHRRKVLTTKQPYNIRQFASKYDFAYYDTYTRAHNKNRLRTFYPPHPMQYQQFRNYEDEFIPPPMNPWIKSRYQDRQKQFYWSNRNIRKKRTGGKHTLRPFWQVDGFKPDNEPMLKSLRYTTLGQQRNKMGRRRTTVNTVRETEKITLELQTEAGLRATEKILSFEELMHLRKSGDNKFLHARRNQPTSATTTTTTATTKMNLSEITTETEFIRVKYCTKKLTCTWTALFENGPDGAGGGNGSTHHNRFIGGLGGGGSRTPPGYVDGCTRTWTCTRPYFEKNKGPTEIGSLTATSSEVEEDYCEKRALERRNLDNDDYTLADTQTLSLGVNIDTTTVAMPSMYEIISETQNDSSESCPCNHETSRKRRHIENYEGRKKTVIDSDLTYGDLFYLVVQRIINKAKKDKAKNSRCFCSNTTCNRFNVLLLFSLLTLLNC